MGIARNVTLSDNALIVGESGYYYIVAMIYGQNITEDAGMQLQFSINNVIQPFTYSLDAETDLIISHTIAKIEALQAGDELRLTLLSVSGLTFEFGPSCPACMTIMKIADLPPQ